VRGERRGYRLHYFLDPDRLAVYRELIREQLGEGFAVREREAQNFSFREEDGQLLLVVEAFDRLTDEQVFCQVQRECDRLFFLTGQQLGPGLLRKEKPDGSSTGFISHTADAFIVKPLAPEINRQDWQEKPLAVQLRLWQLAQFADLPVAARINLLFQIIEITYPDRDDYPKYECPSNSPHPRTEAKLLRDLVTHGKKKMDSPQVKLYCQHLGISGESHDPTDADFLRVLHSRFSVVKDEAHRVIEASITKG